MKGDVKILPTQYEQILNETINIRFEQSSGKQLGSLLATLAATKPSGRFLELGTGTGLSTVWMLHGMDSKSRLCTIDTDTKSVAVAKSYLAEDTRAQFIVGDAAQLIETTEYASLDFIFADAWPGKYSLVAQTLELLRKGGIYLIDDMNPRDSWPNGHAEKAEKLIEFLEQRSDFLISKLCWSSGIIICTKKDDL